MNSLAIYPANNPKIDLTEGKKINVEEIIRDLDSPTVANQSRPVYPVGDDSAMNSLAVKFSNMDASLLACNEPDASEALEIRDWAFAKSNIPERPQLLFPQDPDRVGEKYEQRKKFFSNKARREAAQIHPRFLYCMDFYDAYFSLSNFTVKLPGFSINCFKYWDGEQPLRYVCKTRDGSAVFWVVQFELVPRSAMKVK